MSSLDAKYRRVEIVVSIVLIAFFAALALLPNLVA